MLRFPRLGIHTLGVLFLILIGLKGIDLLLIELNRRDLVLPQFDLTLMPYHDPRVTIRSALLERYERPPRVIFTGDSRVKNGIDPEVVAADLHVRWRTLFNFGTGSQVVRFAREVVVAHLSKVGRRPEILVFGVSPDWPLEKRELWRLIDEYKLRWPTARSISTGGTSRSRGSWSCSSPGTSPSFAIVGI